MTPMKEAVSTAHQFIADLYPQAQDIRLEEIQPIEPTKWKVVFSFQVGEISALASVISNNNRLFKTVEIDRNTNEALSLTSFKL